MPSNHMADKNVVVFVAIGWLVATLLLAYREYRAVSISSLPQAQGIVRKCESRGAGVSLTYSYTVDGKTYRGFQHNQARDTRAADKLAKRFVGQTEVVVHYVPANPNESWVEGFGVSLESGRSWVVRIFTVALPSVFLALGWVVVLVWERFEASKQIGRGA